MFNLVHDKAQWPDLLNIKPNRCLPRDTGSFLTNLITFSLEYSSLLRIIIRNVKERKCQSIATIYILINFIWLHVSTCRESFSGHLNLLFWPNNYYKWNAGCLVKAISLDALKITHCESKHVAIWNLSLYIYIYSCDRLTFHLFYFQPKLITVSFVRTSVLDGIRWCV
jgi:hypothetical protein